MAEVLVRFGVDAPVSIVPNGVDLRLFREATTPIDRAKFDFGSQDVLLIFTGRLGPEKNLHFLLRSFAGIAQAYSNVDLILVGDGPERENLQEWVERVGLSPRVCFTGMLPYEQLPAYLAMADAFVTASVTEVHPLSVIEAMASGLPVLGIRSPGVGDTVQDQVSGLLVPEEDLAAFTAKLARLITEPELRKEMGQRARQAAQSYAIERTVQLMAQCYQNLVNRSALRKRGFRSRVLRLLDRWGAG
jgi:glycosyltransferase involved in cell wall biosynthesis